MNDLGHRLLIDSGKKRQIDILSILMDSEVPVSLIHLSQKCQVTLKTIQKDAQVLVEMFPDQLFYENNYLSVKKNTDMLLLTKHIRSIVRNSPLFSILEAIFDGKYITTSGLLEEWYVSESTLRKYLAYLKDILNEYEIEMNTNPLYLIGNEVNIRYFYFHFFDYKYFDYEEINHSEFTSNNYHNPFEDFGKSYSRLLNINYQALEKWLFIIKKRTSMKKFIQLKEETINKYSSHSGFLLLKKNLAKEVIIEEQDIPESEYVFLYLVMINNVIYDGNSMSFTNELVKEFRQFEPLVDMFFDTVNLNYSVHMDLKILLTGFLVNLNALSDTSDIFQTTNSYLKDNIEKKYPHILAIWYKILKNNANFIHTYDMAIKLTVFTVSKMNTVKKVLFLIMGPPAVISYSKYLALKNLPQKTEAVFLLNQPFKPELIEKMNIDLLVCNFTVVDPLKNCEMYFFSNILSDVEWSNFRLYLDEKRLS